MWVTWVNSEHIQDMMELNYVVKFHDNRMKNEGGGYRFTRLNTKNVFFGPKNRVRLKKIREKLS